MTDGRLVPVLLIDDDENDVVLFRRALLATGAKVWEFEAGAALSASPAIADGKVVIGAQDGRLYCFG